MASGVDRVHDIESQARGLHLLGMARVDRRGCLPHDRGEWQTGGVARRVPAESAEVNRRGRRSLDFDVMFEVARPTGAETPADTAIQGILCFTQDHPKLVVRGRGFAELAFDPVAKIDRKAGIACCRIGRLHSIEAKRGRGDAGVAAVGWAAEPGVLNIHEVDARRERQQPGPIAPLQLRVVAAGETRDRLELDGQDLGVAFDQLQGTAVNAGIAGAVAIFDKCGHIGLHAIETDADVARVVGEHQVDPIAAAFVGGRRREVEVNRLVGEGGVKGLNGVGDKTGHVLFRHREVIVVA